MLDASSRVRAVVSILNYCRYATRNRIDCGSRG